MRTVDVSPEVLEVVKVSRDLGGRPMVCRCLTNVYSRRKEDEEQQQQEVGIATLVFIHTFCSFSKVVTAVTTLITLGATFWARVRPEVYFDLAA